MERLTIVSSSPDETVGLGRTLGRLLRAGDFLALTGELGAGKTRLAQGIAVGLEVPDDTPVTSPTYTILNSYHGTIPLYHFDLYRLRGAEEVEELGFDEYFHGDGVSVVEWAERLGDELPADLLTLSCRHLDEQTREITLSSSGPRSLLLLTELRRELSR